MLTELQHQVRRIVARLPESGVFALAGGAALIVSGIVARPTNDLDFFAPHPQSVGALLEAAQAALEAEGLAVTRLSEGPTFARLRVVAGDEATNVDLASDYRLMPALSTGEGLVLTEAELAADKVLALAGRAEARDYVDFEGLVTRFDIDKLCELAASKDLGFRREHLAAALEYFDEIEPDEFSAYTDDYDRLSDCVHASRRSLDTRQRRQPGPSAGIEP